jgi:hypothetical protein
VQWSRVLATLTRLGLFASFCVVSCGPALASTRAGCWTYNASEVPQTDPYNHNWAVQIDNPTIWPGIWRWGCDVPNICTNHEQWPLQINFQSFQMFIEPNSYKSKTRIVFWTTVTYKVHLTYSIYDKKRKPLGKIIIDAEYHPARNCADSHGNDLEVLDVIAPLRRIDPNRAASAIRNGNISP